MPIYEFYCPKNHTLYSFFARRTIAPALVPRCPDDPSAELRRVVSNFAVIGKATEATDPMPAELDDPRMEAAMAQLEREMGSMDGDNPDPRQLGQMMRRMSELSGEKIPPEMEAMVRKLEEGTDPEKLEDDYAGMLDQDLGPEDDASTLPRDPAGEDRAQHGLRSAWKRLSQRSAPTRDPQLYEWDDYR